MCVCVHHHSRLLNGIRSLMAKLCLIAFALAIFGVNGMWKGSASLPLRLPAIYLWRVMKK